MDAHTIKLFLVLLGSSVIAILIGAPAQARALVASGVAKGEDRKLPLIAALVLQGTLLASIASFLGAVLAPRAGLQAPFFAALANGAVDPSVSSQLTVGLLWGVIGSAIMMAFYYGWVRRRLEPAAVATMEKARVAIGALTRIVMGGVLEEVLFRWGAMTTLAWVGSALLGGPSEAIVWTAIVLSGVLFGLAHIPGSTEAGFRLTPMLIAAAIVLNLSVALIFGWLYWQYGLLAAMVAHGAVHALWHPVDRVVLGRRSNATMDLSR